MILNVTGEVWLGNTCCESMLKAYDEEFVQTNGIRGIGYQLCIMQVEVWFNLGSPKDYNMKIDFCPFCGEKIESNC